MLSITSKKNRRSPCMGTILVSATSSSVPTPHGTTAWWSAATAKTTRNFTLLTVFTASRISKPSLPSENALTTTSPCVPSPGALPSRPYSLSNDENPLLSVGQPYIYNKDLFEQAGLDPEDTPETWSEFMEICKTLKDSGVIPVSADNDRWIFWSLGDISGQFGEKYVDQFFDAKYNDDPDGVLFTDKVRISLANGNIADVPYYDDIFNIWKDFTQYWQDGWMGTTYDESRNLFVMQQAAMLKIGNWDHDYFKTTVGDDFEWGVFPAPSIDEATSDKAMGAFKAPSGQQNPTLNSRFLLKTSNSPSRFMALTKPSGSPMPHPEAYSR